METLNINRRNLGGVTILDLSGKVNIGDTSRQLRETLRRMADAGDKKVILDLANVISIDSSGLGEIVAAFTTMRSHGGEVKLLHLTERASDLMMITKLHTVFDIFDSEDLAVASFDEDTGTAEAIATPA